MADQVLSYTIPDGKKEEYIDDYCYIHKNAEVDEEGQPIYSNGQWVREHILRYIKSQIVRGKDLKYKDAQETLNADDIT